MVLRGVSDVLGIPEIGIVFLLIGLLVLGVVWVAFRIQIRNLRWKLNGLYVEAQDEWDDEKEW